MRQAWKNHPHVLPEQITSESLLTQNPRILRRPFFPLPFCCSLTTKSLSSPPSNSHLPLSELKRDGHLTAFQIDFKSEWQKCQMVVREGDRTVTCMGRRSNISNNSRILEIWGGLVRKRRDKTDGGWCLKGAMGWPRSTSVANAYMNARIPCVIVTGKVSSQWRVRSLTMWKVNI